MALRVVSAAPLTGCAQHRDLQVDVEGTVHQDIVTLGEIDKYLDNMFPQNVDKIRALVFLWGWYRRLRGCALVGIDIA